MNVLSTDVKMVTPEDATAYLSLVEFGQRNILAPRVNKYAQIMQSGQWVIGDGVIVIGRIRDSQYLVSGQHRLSAVVKSGVAVPLTVSVREYESMDELKQDYAHGTNQGSAFTTGQILHALDTAQQVGVSKGVLAGATTAIVTIAADFTARGGNDSASPLTSTKTLHQVVLSWETPIRAYDNAIKSAYRAEHIWFIRGSVMAVGLITFRYQPELAQKFWVEAAENDGLAKYSPQSMLRRYLSTTNVATIRRDCYARQVARIWNAFVDNREISKLYGDGDGVEIKGTPFKKNAPKGTGIAVLGIK